MKFQELRFGVEIETIKRSRGDVADAIQTVVGGNAEHVGSPSCYDPWHVVDERRRTWMVVADASLTNVPANLRAEVVSPVLDYEDIQTLQDVVRAVRRCGATVDEKCGIHIHVDATAFDGKTLGNLAKIVHKQEPLILTALGVSESRLSNYTKPVGPELIAKIERSRPKTREQMNRIWYGYHNQNPQHYDQTRYHGVNLHNVWYRGTVEFRWFQATLHAGKVRAAVQFVLAIAAKALNSRGASSRKREFDPASAKYDFRVFLLHLGLIGDEFKTARKHLLNAMPGDAALEERQAEAEESEACRRDIGGGQWSELR